MIPQSAVEPFAAPARWRRPFERWFDGVEAGWAIPLLLVVFVGLWMAFLALGYQGADLHPDTLETWTIGREFAWGNPKHPPLMGWIAGGWAALFPLTDWSFYLLAMVNSAVALYAVDLISRRFVRGDGRMVILLLLLLIPAYQFHAQRFNANTVLLALWPLATYFFLRSVETHYFRWAIAAGAATALAMLGKYYSVFLVAGFAVAALAHPQRRAYFLSAAPWVSMLAGLAVLGPHLWWLATNGSEPFEYAKTSHAGHSLAISAKYSASYVVGNAAYLILPVVVWLVMIRAQLRRFLSNLRTLDPSLRLLLWILATTVLLPPLVSLVMGADLPPLWNLQALFLAVVVLVAAATFAIARFDSVNLSLGVMALLLAAILVAPFYASYRNTTPFGFDRNFLSASALELTRRWHQATDKPLSLVSGQDSLAFATAFYSPDHPVYSRPFRFQYTWGMPRQSTLDRGWAAMCFTSNAGCMEWMKRVVDTRQRAVRSDFTVHASLRGVRGASAQVAALIVTPLSPVAPKPVLLDDDDRIEDFGASRRRRQDD